MSFAQTESLNNVIREIDRAGRGYTFDVLRAKMLFRGSIAKKVDKSLFQVNEHIYIRKGLSFFRLSV